MASNVIDVYVKLPNGKTLQFDLAASDTMGKVYGCVAEREGIAEDRITLKYTGKVLKKTPTLGKLGVCAETILKAEILQVQMWSVIVSLPSGETIPVEIQNISPVSYIKDQVETQAGIPAKKQILKFDDTKITNIRQSVISAGIKNESQLTVELKEELPAGSNKSKSKRDSSTRHGSGDYSSGENGDDDAESGRETKGSTVDKSDSANLDDEDKEAILSTFDAAGRRVDVVFSFDTTGSMYSCLQKVRQKLQETVERLTQHIPTIRIGVIAHGDYCDYDKYVLRYVDLTSDVHSLVDFVNNVPATGGGDTPECYEWVLHKALHMDWSEDSAKALVVIGDCKPHEPSYTDQSINWHEQLDLLKGMGVKVYGVKAMHNDDSEPFYQELSDRTGGAFITFANFSIITEMFLAVCYREASDEQFEAFCDEVDQRQEVTSDDHTQRSNSKVKDIQQVLTQLKEQKDKEAEDRPKRYIAAPWWDPSLDHGSPHYSYNREMDKWSHITVDNTRSTTTGLTRSATFHGKSSSSDRGRRMRRMFSFRNKSTSSRGSDLASKTRGSKKGCTVM